MEIFRNAEFVLLPILYVCQNLEYGRFTNVVYFRKTRMVQSTSSVNSSHSYDVVATASTIFGLVAVDFIAI